VSATEEIMTNPDKYRKMAKSGSPYGDGMAAKRILSALKMLLINNETN